MNNSPSPKPNRRSIRLPGFDYSQAGEYFVTLVTARRESIFGAVSGGELVLNKFGEIVRAEWLHTEDIRENVALGEYAVMPNHFHGIIHICTGTARRAPTGDRTPTVNVEQFGKPVAGSIPTIMRSFKSAVTKRINETRNTPGAPVWQRNYYEHIIRDDADYTRIARYIADNPLNWEKDEENL